MTWLLIASILLLTAYFHGPSYNQQTVRIAPSILTSFGIFGTFLGIAFGLMQFDSADIEASVPRMIDGLGVAVWSSIVGILGALSIRLRFAIRSVNDHSRESRAMGIEDLQHSLEILNQGLQQLREESRDGAQALLHSNRQYQDDMASANASALTRALNDLMRDFNSHIEVQYGENFQQFNSSLGQILRWQQTYTAQLDDMRSAQQASLEVIQRASESHEQMIEHSREFNRVAGSLGELLKGLENQTRDLEGYLDGLSGLVGNAQQGLPALSDYVTDLTVKLSDSIEENNRVLSGILSQAASDITATVDQVSRSLADSVNQAHGGLAEHVREMNDKTAAHMKLLDESMEKELNQALQTFGYQLTALSEKFVNDYVPLTDKLRELIAIAENQPLRAE